MYATLSCSWDGLCFYYTDKLFRPYVGLVSFVESRGRNFRLILIKFGTSRFSGPTTPPIENDSDRTTFTITYHITSCVKVVTWSTIFSEVMWGI